MSKSLKFFGFLLFGSFLLAACSSGPLRETRKGEEIAYYDFSQAGTFEESAYLGGVARLRIDDNLYRIELSEGDGELWWGQWGETLDNVIIDVDVEQLSDRAEHAFGVMCRVRGTVGQEIAVDPDLQEIVEADATPSGEDAETNATPLGEEGEESQATQETVEEDAESEAEEQTTVELIVPEGDGYLFLIQSNGRFSIQRSRGGEVTRLVDWKDSGALNTGPEKNRLRAVCMDDYLALYINDEFAGDVIDDTYSSGQVGLAASTRSPSGVTIEFDNLSVSEVRPG